MQQHVAQRGRQAGVGVDPRQQRRRQREGQAGHRRPHRQVPALAREPPSQAQRRGGAGQAQAGGPVGRVRQPLAAQRGGRRQHPGAGAEQERRRGHQRGMHVPHALGIGGQALQRHQHRGQAAGQAHRTALQARRRQQHLLRQRGQGGDQSQVHQPGDEHLVRHAAMPGVPVRPVEGGKSATAGGMEGDGTGAAKLDMCQSVFRSGRVSGGGIPWVLVWRSVVSRRGGAVPPSRWRAWCRRRSPRRSPASTASRPLPGTPRRRTPRRPAPGRSRPAPGSGPRGR